MLMRLQSSAIRQVMVEQMYVEELRPLNQTRTLPIVFWHGMGQTGIGWVTTPDVRPGWASYFLSQGYTVYIVDSPERGRSPWLPESSKLISTPAEYAEKFWTATRDNGGVWPQAGLHSQWPGTGRRGDPCFDDFMASQVQSRNDYARAEELAGKLGQALFERIGPAILCTHSQGGGHGWAIADLVPERVKAIVALEPVGRVLCSMLFASILISLLGPPFVNRIASVVKKPDPREIRRPYGLTVVPISYDPPLSNDEQLVTTTIPSQSRFECDTILQKEPVRRLSNLSRIPVLVVTGESGYHAFYDHATVAFLRQAGVDVTWLNLPEVNVRGNGHFMFLEKNNIEVAEHIHDWLIKHQRSSSSD